MQLPNSVRPILAIGSVLLLQILVVDSISAQKMSQVLIAPYQNSNGFPWIASGPKWYAGEIVRFDARQLVLQSEGEQPQSFDAELVIGLRPHWESDRAAEADSFYRAGEYRQAVEKVPAALQSGIPLWQQQLLVVELVRGIEEVVSPRVAFLQYLKLAATQPPVMYYGDLPLCWTSREPDSALRDRAIEWVKDADEHARLMGASWLLLGPESQIAMHALQELRLSKNEAIAKLAVTQLWRISPPSETMQSLSNWRSYRDQLVLPIQLGPSEFLAERLFRIGQHDLALGEWSRIVAIHSEQPIRVARCREAIAKCLKQAGREADLEKLSHLFPKP
ncbi:MAG: hypothetical protein KDB03_21360 [Planctomycetales bacterium]|nr:hypothetical protein [Planctomycetales bacterium]